ncbi:adenylyl-sulfate kinase [Candidatus Magnetaquicoccus inordinatus]|uniref:adenylyl-sulfate kinase n=1 Tax=Candidatus Magnetaquicoccus inordinatus TaxID=2496818 RepID=UPI00102CF5A3|nr:adenylyl-sulfate kinase [Candidatus Magnetaquicoccus inordinatus]
MSNSMQHAYQGIARADREKRIGHRSLLIWFTGLSGSGKSTMAVAMEAELQRRGLLTYVLDGDVVRRGLCSDLGFSLEDRTENIRRIGEVAKLMVDAGVIVLAAFISPLAKDRQRVREIMPEGSFFEVYCNSSLSVCEHRDVKGLYKKAREGKIAEFTGISSVYEEPSNPEMILPTGTSTVASCVEQLMSAIMAKVAISAAEHV